MSPYQAYRVQQFSPPSGKIKLGRARKAVNDFINECFNSDGGIKDFAGLEGKTILIGKGRKRIV